MLLALRTGSSKTSLALIKNKKVLIESSWESDNDEAEKLMPNLQALLKKSRAKFSDIDQVLVIKGPGSFTGLRIGVTVANTISYLNNCELFAVDTFEYYWRAVNLKETESSIALLIFAGAKGVYVSLPGQTNFAEKAKNIPIDALQTYLQRHSIKNVFGDITNEQKTVLKDIRFVKIDRSFGEIISKINLKKLSPVKIVKPLYIKKPAITQSKRAPLPNS